MILWLKFIHIAAIAIWCAGLITLPGIYVQRTPSMLEEAHYRLQALVRFVYVAIVSPAAFIAVASGTALVFLRQTFVPWFSVKLAFVAALVFVHALTGLVIIRLFRGGEVYPVWRFIAVTVLTLAIIGAILTLVLAKPDLDRSLLPTILAEPGALRRAVQDLSPWPIP
jgi:uncharacterized membrane protein